MGERESPKKKQNDFEKLLKSGIELDEGLHRFEEFSPNQNPVFEDSHEINTISLTTVMDKLTYLNKVTLDHTGT